MVAIARGDRALQLAETVRRHWANTAGPKARTADPSLSNALAFEHKHASFIGGVSTTASRRHRPPPWSWRCYCRKSSIRIAIGDVNVPQGTTSL